jgi:hypothetical protein
MSAAWDKLMVLPKDMSQPGTMLVNGLPCPTHHIVDNKQGFFVCMGQLFWSRVLGVLSSRPSSVVQTLILCLQTVNHGMCVVSTCKEGA